MSSASQKWTEASIPDQAGRVALVTGANSGIGWDTARALAARGAHVILACRDPRRGHDAIDRLHAECPEAKGELLELDLADLASVERAAEACGAEHSRLDLLINNAGLMMTPEQRTAQGFEMQLGVNHLGHFALTGRLLPLLLATPDSRVVTVSSTGHRPGRIDLEDPNWERRSYRPAPAYFQSKLANLMFTFELQRRLAYAGAGTAALAAHPGGARTHLGNEAPPGLLWSLLDWMRPLIMTLLQSSGMGALPTLRAAVDPDARGGEYYGPGGFAEGTGPPVRVGSSRRARDARVAVALWQLSEELTGVRFDLPASA